MTDGTMNKLYYCAVCGKMVGGTAHVHNGKIFHPTCWLLSSERIASLKDDEPTGFSKRTNHE